MSLWCVAGAPLSDGSGWRIWYATPNNQPFAASGPGTVVVRRQGQVISTTQQWRPKTAPADLARQVGVLTVRLTKPAPGQDFEVSIAELAGRPPLLWQTMPTTIGPNGASLFLSSCFWQNDDKEGYYRTAVQAILAQEKQPKPAFKLLIGDQLYLDWPSSLDFDSAGKNTAQRYEQYWGDEAYRDVLLATPNFFLCDDHEYWNDFPDKQIQLERTWTQKSRDEYTAAANQFYEAFQAANNGEPHRWFQINISPVSFFVTDTRSDRTPANDPNPHFMGSKQFDELKEWQVKLTGPGILILGQPLFQKDGDYKDHSLSNFEQDYRALTGLIADSLDGRNEAKQPHDILVLSGDIHTGRHARAWVPSQIPGRAGNFVHELIASPASRVLVSSTFDGQPDPELPPASIPPTPHAGDARWTIGSDGDVLFTTIDNNIGVLRLFPSAKNQGGVRVEFGSYLVRRCHQPLWKRSWFSSDSPQKQFASGAVSLYESRNKTPIELR